MLPIEVSGGSPETKFCTECKRDLPVDNFRKRQEGRKKARIYTYCKECEKKLNSILDDIKKYVRPQPDACECCGKETTELVVDHCHETNKMRGWICTPCNVGISRLQDGLPGVLMAVKYLERFENGGSV